eukprot:m.147341 g.147341  ORF g.147341 m.147341 type:complete len:325 (+) comp30530_c1_seq2:144-1118(+)
MALTRMIATWVVLFWCSQVVELSTATAVLEKLHLNADVRLQTSHDNNNNNYFDTLIDWEAVKLDIEAEFESNPRYDDGTLAPIMIRLAWHSASTFDPLLQPYGGCNGATMRFDPEASYHDNKGLEIAITALEVVKKKHPTASYSDIWVLAGYAAVESMRGPKIQFRPGRVDKSSGGDNCPPEERIPQWDEPAAALREKFGRMGLNDRDIVALSGAHSVGHTHEDHSGFPYHQWDNTPIIFDNTYYSFLLENWWFLDDDNRERPYYRNRSWLMLLSDFALREDATFKSIVDDYATDESMWHSDFAIAFKKVTELGMDKQPNEQAI